MSEPYVEQIRFKVVKFSNRPKPEKRDVVLLPMFSEFGCETLAVLYCLPWLLRHRLAGKYIIVLGWAGREFFYRHLADEFWELDDEHQWLRDYCKAFHHTSRNLAKFEKQAQEYGTVLPIGEVANVSIYPLLSACPYCKGEIFQTEQAQKCSKCAATFGPAGFFHDLTKAKAMVRWLPPLSDEALSRVRDFLPGRAVGITARNRKTYGRNLPLRFYERLIHLVEDMGYNPVWIGEPSTTYPCPYRRIPDFASSPLAGDLENTLALVSQTEFTVQFFTASSRLAAMVGTPFLIVESPDQIWGVGQEGIRLNLMCKNDKRKLIACQFLDCRDRPGDLLDLVERGVRDIEAGDFEDIIGLVGNVRLGEVMRRWNAQRIGEHLRSA